MQSLEILALVLIVIGIIKIIVLAINPKSWMEFAEKIWKKPILMQIICLILALAAFKILLDSGLNIIQILAVTAFVTLLMAVAIAPEVKDLIKKYENRIRRGSLWKQYWLYIILWIILLLWGLKEMFM